MIKEIIKTPNQRYGRFFLSTEAPDDESTIKANTKVIEVKPNNRSRKDFTSDAEIFPEDEPDELTADDVTDTSVPEENMDNINTETEPEVVNNDDTNVEMDNTDTNQDTTVPDENNVDDSGEVTDTTDVIDPNNQNTDIAGEDGPDTGDDVDFTSDADLNNGGSDTQETQPEQAEGENQQKGPGLEYDSTRKFKLFQNFISLINALEKYIAKLESSMGDVLETNSLYGIVIKKLRDVKDLAFDYMTLKFELASYVQSLLFYENLIVMIQLIFDYLKKGNETIMKNRDSNKK